MRKWLLATCILGMGLTSCFGGQANNLEQIQYILSVRRHSEDSSPVDDLRHFAETNGLTDGEMSQLLLQLVKSGLSAEASATQQRLAKGALWGLVPFGGDAENSFVMDIMRTTGDATMRHMAVRVGIRMMPEKWEEWVRAASSGDRFDSMTRFGAYEEACRIGQSGNKQTRNRVEQVLSELAEQESSAGNRSNLQRWANDLKER